MVSSDFLNLCADTDDDGFKDLGEDIDDDNDGIRDAVESPGCYFTIGNFEQGDRSQFITVSTEMAMSATYMHPAELVDGLNGTSGAEYAVQFNNSQAVANKEIFRFDFVSPIEISNIYLQYINGSSHFNNALIKFQGSNDGSTWTDLRNDTTYTTAANSPNPITEFTNHTDHFDVTQNQGKYSSYRLYGVSGTTFSSGYSKEVFFAIANFQAEDYPKDQCDADADNDGMYNHVDLDSDNDSCPDLSEANAGAIGQSLITGSVGNNGLADNLETTPDNGIINYEIAYSDFANDSTLVVCLDSDGDGVGNVFDLDDDNDGIPDEIEACDCDTGGPQRAMQGAMSSSWHNTIAKVQGGGFVVFGDAAGPTSGCMPVMTMVTPENGYDYSGKPLHGCLSYNQFFMMTSDNLYTWGNPTCAPRTDGSRAFAPMDMPAGVKPKDVKWMDTGGSWGGSGGLFLLTNKGNVWVRGHTLELHGTGNADIYKYSFWF